MSALEIGLRMSVKERDRLEVLVQVKEGQLRQSHGAELLGITDRQLRRSMRRWEEEGDAGLIHRSRGRRSNRGIEEGTRRRAVKLIGEHYADFGPTLASETLLERDGIAVSRETVRQWMVDGGLWQTKRRRVKHRQWRERRACFGELVQMDTSEHDWFEGRGEKAVLINLIDDATSRVLMRFFPRDTAAANRRLLRDYIRRYGRPVAVYADKASHFKVNRGSSVEEELLGVEAETQIGRALRELDIEYIAAHSPQAKGRVERSFGTCQDRLVKALRLEGISTIEEANRYLEQTFLPLWNKRFASPPANSADVHRSAKGYDLNALLSHQESRVVGHDYTVRYRGQRYQIRRESIGAGLRGSKVTVEQRLDGTLKLRWRGKYLRCRRVKSAARRQATRQARAAAGSSVGLRPPSKPAVPKPKPDKAVKPAPHHPWKNPHTRTFLFGRKPDISTLR